MIEPNHPNRNVWDPEDEIAAWQEEYQKSLAGLETFLRSLFFRIVKHPLYDRASFLKYLGRVLKSAEIDFVRQDIIGLYEFFETVTGNKVSGLEFIHRWFDDDLLIAVCTVVHPFTRPVEFISELNKIIPQDRKKTSIYFDFLVCNGLRDRFYKSFFVRTDSHGFLDLMNFTRLSPKEFPCKMQNFLDTFYRNNPDLFEFSVLNPEEIKKVIGRNRKKYVFVVK